MQLVVQNLARKAKMANQFDYMNPAFVMNKVEDLIEEMVSLKERVETLELERVEMHQAWKKYKKTRAKLRPTIV